MKYINMSTPSRHWGHIVCLLATSLVGSGASLAQTTERSLKDWIDDMEVQGPAVPAANIYGETVDNDRITLRRLEFATGSHILTQQHQDYLDSIAGHLLRIPGVTISVQGHTDNVGNSIRNQQLSQRRANSVRDQLIKKGFPEGSIASTGFGEDRPVPEAAANATEEQRRMNRRVELVLVTDELAAKAASNSAPASRSSGGKKNPDEFEIVTKDGRTIRTSFVVFSADGSEMSYQDPTDAKVMKRLRTVELDRVITPDGKPIRLTDVQKSLAEENTSREAKEREQQARYEELIRQADQAYEAKRLEEAALLYREASILRPKEAHARERLRAIASNSQATIDERGTAVVLPAEPKSRITRILEESFGYFGIGVAAFGPRINETTLHVRTEIGMDLYYPVGRNSIPMSFSGCVGYEWESRRSRGNLYFRGQYEFMILQAQLHKGSFGVGYALNDRYRAGLDFFMGVGNQRLDPVTIPQGTVTVNGVTFGPGEVHARYTQRITGVAPNFTFGFPLGAKWFARTCAGVAIPFDREPGAYILKLKGTAPDGSKEKVSLYSNKIEVYDHLEPDKRKLIQYLGPYINFQIVIP